MKLKISTLSALAVVLGHSGLPVTATAQQAASVRAECDIYAREGNRTALQDQLAILLETDPSNVCIDYIVDLLGGSPIAQVPPQAEPY